MSPKLAMKVATPSNPNPSHEGVVLEVSLFGEEIILIPVPLLRFGSGLGLSLGLGLILELLTRSLCFTRTSIDTLYFRCPVNSLVELSLGYLILL